MDRFKQQYEITEKYIIPYVGAISYVLPLNVLEIGCGEGGNLAPFFNRGCKVTGIDKSDVKIDIAQSYYPFPEVKFVYSDFYEVKPRKYDLILIKDVLEHVYYHDLFLDYLQYFLKPDSKVFIAFSPWSMPFGGHQQCCKSFLRYIPYLHLTPFYEALLIRFETPAKAKALLEIKETRISVKQFKAMVKDYKIEKEDYWLINPAYDIKFGLKPVKFINIPFLTTSYWCVISIK